MQIETSTCCTNTKQYYSQNASSCQIFHYGPFWQPTPWLCHTHLRRALQPVFIIKKSFLTRQSLIMCLHCICIVAVGSGEPSFISHGTLRLVWTNSSMPEEVMPSWHACSSSQARSINFLFKSSCTSSSSLTSAPLCSHSIESMGKLVYCNSDLHRIYSTIFRAWTKRASQRLQK